MKYYDVPMLEKSANLEAFKDLMGMLQECCLQHPADYLIDLIEFVEVWMNSENDGPSGGGLFRLSDGRWGAMEESQDYTGHG